MGRFIIWTGARLVDLFSPADRVLVSVDIWAALSQDHQWSYRELLYITMLYEVNVRTGN